MKENIEGKTPKEYVRDRDEEIRSGASKVRQERAMGRKPGYTGEDMDNLFREKNIKPGTAEAIQFLKRWDLTQALRIEATEQASIRERAEAAREAKISSLEFGKNRFAKLFGGLKKLAVEGGRGLMAVGLYPSAIIEKTVREIAGKIQVDQEIKRQFATAGKLEYLESIPANKRPDYYAKLTESLTAISRKGAAEVEKGYDLMHKKGKILRFLETHGGRVGGAMGDELTPSEY